MQSMTRLLIVDNDADRIKDLVNTALAVGFPVDNIVRADSQQAAYEQIDQMMAPFDLAIVDICLTHHEPHAKEGLDVIRKLRSHNPGCKIIGLTRMGGTEFGTEALLAGADDFISTQ